MAYEQYADALSQLVCYANSFVLLFHFTCQCHGEKQLSGDTW